MIESKRLILRKMCIDDFNQISNTLRDIKIMYSCQHSFTDDEVLKWIKKNIQRYNDFGYGYFVAIDKASNNIVGQIGLLNRNNGIGIGYIINKNSQNKGYATEGAIACIDYAIEKLKIYDIYADIRRENQKSINVAEKLGMKKVSSFKKFYDNKKVIYDIYNLSINPNRPTKIVKIEEYNPLWKSEFIYLKNKLTNILGKSIIKIEHVGSTAVEGLCAKPRLDIDIVIEDYSFFDDVSRKLNKLGYIHVGNWGVEGREVFLYDKSPFMDHNLYVCPKDGKGYIEHIKLRDYLINNRDKANDYSILKQKLSEKFRYDIDTYCDLKTDFIMNILSKI